MQPPDSTHSAIRQILLQDWDPHNAAREPAAHNTYDAYLTPLHDLIASGADEQSIMDWLHDREKETMCFPSLGKERLRRVARKLLRAAARTKATGRTGLPTPPKTRSPNSRVDP